MWTPVVGHREFSAVLNLKREREREKGSDWFVNRGLAETMVTRNEKQSPHLRLSQRPSGDTGPRAAGRRRETCEWSGQGTRVSPGYERDELRMMLRILVCLME